MQRIKRSGSPPPPQYEAGRPAFVTTLFILNYLGSLSSSYPCPFYLLLFSYMFLLVSLLSFPSPSIHTVLEFQHQVRYGNPNILRAQEQDRRLKPRDATNLNTLLI